MKRKIIAFIWSILILLFCYSACALTTVDAKDSQTEYGKQVAALNTVPEKTKRGETGNTVLLLKTDGSPIDFSETDAEICICGPGNRYTLLFFTSESAQKAINELQQNKHILYVEKDSVVEQSDTAEEDDISFYSYGAEEMGFRPLISWARKTEGNEIIAVIDSGVGTHPVLSSRIEKGWDYIDNDDDPTNDENGHGTHVAGILADCTQGISSKIYAIRILNSSGKGNVSNAANAILEAAGHGVSVINLSFLAQGKSEALEDAVGSAVAAGSAVVISAGNNGQDASGYSPASMMLPGVIVVGSVGLDGKRASYSNYGSSVDCFAYGSGINSCQPGGGYVKKSGTSQAAPHITAACALLKRIYGDNPGGLENRIKALSGEAIPIPQVNRTVPQLISCHLEEITMGLGERLALPVRAEPEESGQEITWNSANESILRVNEDSSIIAVSEGKTTLTRRCSNFADISIPVTVSNEASGFFKLPDSLITIDEGALEGISARFLIAGDKLENIGKNSIDQRTVVLCENGSPVADWAEEEGIQYIAN